MTTDAKIEKMHKEKIKRWDNQGLGAQIGGTMHDAVALAIARLQLEKGILATREDYLEEIKYWLDKLIKIADDKKEYMAIPVIEESNPTPPLKIPPNFCETDEAKRLKLQEEGINIPS